MFYPARMKRVTILVHRATLDAAVAAVHEAGLMEVSEFEDDGLEIEGGDEQRDALSRYLMRAQRLLDILQPYAAPKRGLIKQFLSPKFPDRTAVPGKDVDALCREADGLLAESERAILSLIHI